MANNKINSESVDFGTLDLRCGGLSINGVGVTATATELNSLAAANNSFTVGPGPGILAGTGTIARTSVLKIGGVYYNKILLDLTGLQSSTTDLDIIGSGLTAAYIGQVGATQNGSTILTGRMTCLEAPLTGVTDIDLYFAAEGTGVFDGGVAALTETAVITSGGAWTIGAVKVFTGIPTVSQYLYLTCGAAGTVGTYTAGKFLIEFEGYD